MSKLYTIYFYHEDKKGSVATVIASLKKVFVICETLDEALNKLRSKYSDIKISSVFSDDDSEII